jgi:hypothetical protein
MSSTSQGSVHTLANLTSRFRLLFVMVITLLFVSAQPTFSADSVSKEYQLKAAFLYNFTKFVTWPSKKFEQSNNKLIIGVIGHNPFGNELAEITRGRTVAGRDIQVRYISSIEDAHSVNLLFVPSTEERKVRDNLRSLHESCVLTVGETDLFASLGGIISFSVNSDKIRFEINREEAFNASLKISPQLLKLAISVRKTM